MLDIKLKKEVKRFCFLLLLMCFAQSVIGQIVNKGGVKLKPYVGLSMPSDNFKSFSKSGIVYGIAIDKFLTDRFVLGVDINTQSTNYSNPFDFSNITSPYTINDEVSGNWHATAFTFGPTYQLGNSKFNAEFYSKAGMLYIKTVNGVYNFQTATETKTIFDLPEQERTSFALTSGVRFNFNVSDRLYVFLNPQYVYSTADIQYCDCGVSELSNPDNILEALPVKKTFNPSYLNINAGLSFSLGGKSNPKKTKETELVSKEEISICEASILKQPYNGETFFAESGKVPEFKWINHSKPKALSYDFELYYGDKLIFEKNIKTDSFKFTKKMTEDFYGIKEAREYSWRVRTNYEDCESTTTNFNSIKIYPKQDTSSRSGPSQCYGDFGDIEINCDSPAFVDGKVKYKGTITIINNSSTPGVLIPHQNSLNNTIVDVLSSGSTLSITSTNLPPSCPPVAYTTVNGYPGYTDALQPTQNATYCFELSVPIGTTSIDFGFGMVTRPGEPDEAFCNPYKNIKLPSCICDICQDWEYIDTEHTLGKFNVQGFPFNFQMAQSLQIVGSVPIMEVKAEIIGVQHIANDPQCYTCTQHENNMGLFSFIPGFLQPRISGVSAQNDWLNGVNATKGEDVNGDNYSNQAIWRAKDPSIGVDFNLMKRFILPISLPDQSSLDCCEHTYKVCVRYTFTTINCETCSYNRCYEYDGKSEPIDISNPSSGVGNTGSNIPNTNLNNN